MHRVLEVSQDEVDPLERKNLHAGGAATASNGRVRDPGIVDAMECTQSIGDYVTATGQKLRCPLGNGFFAKAVHGTALQENRMAFFGSLYGGKKRVLARGSAPTFATSALAAPIRIVNLDPSLQRLRIFRLQQRSGDHGSLVVTAGTLIQTPLAEETVFVPSARRTAIRQENKPCVPRKVAEVAW